MNNDTSFFDLNDEQVKEKEGIGKRSLPFLFVFICRYCEARPLPEKSFRKKGGGKEVLKNSYRDTPTIRVGSLLLDKGGRTPPVSRYSALSFHHLADSIRPEMINTIRFQKYSNNKYNKLRPVIGLNRKSPPER